MNSVSYIKFIVKSNPLSEETKIKLKKAGPHRPPFTLVNSLQEFNTDYYKLTKWLCGCPERKALFCYICLVTDNTRSGPWVDGVTTGIENCDELKTRLEKHQHGKKHMVNNLDYALVGSNIRERNKEWSSTVIQHNERVQDHRYILNKLINCVKDENEVNFVEKINTTLKDSSVCLASKETICDELLESIYNVCIDLIRKEIAQTDYVSVEFDEATKSGRSDLILLVRYELRGQIHERFVKFIEKSDELLCIILKELEKLDIDETTDKFISYSHDGLSLNYGKNENHTGIKSLYERAKFIPSYAHKLDLIIERVASQHREVKIFFANLQNFSDFFSNAKYIVKLDKALEKRLPRGTKIKWNFDTQTVFLISLHKDSIKECLDQIMEEEIERPLIAKTAALKSLLSDLDFIFWLDFFNKILPDCDRLFNQLFRREGTDVAKVRQYLEIFKAHVKIVEHAIDNESDAPPNKRQCRENVVKEEITIEEVDLNQVKQEINEMATQRSDIAKSVCEMIVDFVEDRFSDLDHLSTAALLQSSFFPQYQVFFPKLEAMQAASAYGLSVKCLESELHIIYNRDELSTVEGALMLLQYLYEYKLTEAFSETFKLLKVICTMPTITYEPGRCFTTLTKVKSLFKKAHQSTKADAFTMCSLEKELMLRTADFNDLVIKDFCRRNNRDEEFEYKRVG